MPSDRFEGHISLTAFTALPGLHQLRNILSPQHSVDAAIEWVDSEVMAHLLKVRASINAMRHKVVGASERRKRAARERHARCQGVKLGMFEEGDFVLPATAIGREGKDRALVWRGPKRVVRKLNDYTFQEQGLMAPFEISTRHASRFQLYRDSARGSKEELLE